MDEMMEWLKNLNNRLLGDVLKRVPYVESAV